MDIDADQLGIPETEYDATVKLSSAEFGRIVRDLSQLGESVRIDVNKEGVRFAADGEAANGSVLLKQAGGGRIERVGAKEKKVKKEEGADEDEEEQKEEEEEEEEDEDTDKKKKKKAKKEKAKVKKEKKDDDDDEMEEDDGGSIKEKEDDEDGEEEVQEDDEEEEGSGDDDDDESGKKRKRSSKANGASKKKTKTASAKGKGKKKDKEEEEDFEGAIIHMNQHVTLTFSLKYLVNFAKSGSLSKVVNLMMSPDMPLMVRYEFGNGKIEYYLAPKIGDE